MPFVSSGLFRVNANHHTLDVWLIHRCKACGRTWNLEVHERTHPRALPPALLHGYQTNDPALALACAHDMRLLRSAGVTADYAGVPIAVDGPRIALSAGRPQVAIEVRADHALPIRMQRILRETLSLSAKAFRQGVSSGLIVCPAADVLRARYAPGLCVLLTGDIVEAP